MLHILTAFVEAADLRPRGLGEIMRKILGKGVDLRQPSAELIDSVRKALGDYPPTRRTLH